MRIHIMVCAILVTCAFQLFEGKMYLGSVTFKQKWADLRAAPSSSQYNIMVRNIENAIRAALKNDSHLQNVKVTQLREDSATKKSTMEGKLAADFELSFRNHSQLHKSVYNLYRNVQRGTLDGIPVQEGSLIIHGLTRLLKRFTLPPPTKPTKAVPVVPHHWPSGSYGLPRPKSGCPDKQWREGFRYHDSENVQNTNIQSNNSHLAGEVNAHGIRQEFCIHVGARGEKAVWPRGKYCIYKKGETCPTGLKEGWIRWDDENTRIDYPNSFGGELPDGIYGENTVVYFCCSTSGRKSKSISLPYGSPFYLLAYGSPKCQEVRYHKATSEYVQFDDEDQENFNARSTIVPYGPTEDLYNTRIYYCYYQPIPCDATTDMNCPSRPSLEEIQDEQVILLLPPEKPSRVSKFVTGSGVGAILISSASVAVLARRFLTARRAHFEIE